jgi:SAM-dependent methyltransferase
MTTDAESTAQRRHALVGPPHLWKLKRDFQISFLKNQGLQPSDFLVDIGCGTLRGGLPIIDFLAAGHYFGVEARSEVLDEAWREIRENNLAAKEPVLIACADFSRLEPAQQFTVAWAFSVFFHMTDAVLVNCLTWVRGHLAPGGRLFANVSVADAPASCWQGFPVVHRSESAYRDLASKCGLEARAVGRLSELGHRSGLPAHDDQLMLLFT